jgi:hypothetical protein
MRKYFILAFVALGAVAIGVAAWGSMPVQRAVAHPNYTYQPGCHCNPNTTTTVAAATTTTTSGPTTTTTTSGTTTSSTTSTTLQPTPAGFNDVPTSHPYYAQITYLAARHVVGGFPDGSFQPDLAVTRQQFAKMIVLALGYPVSLADVCPFSDVTGGLSSTDPLYPDHYVAVCFAHKITEGTSPGRFSPYGNMTRAQLITMVTRTAGLPDPPSSYVSPFPDFSPVHFPWARKAADGGLLEGLAGIGPSYDFWASASRGDVCALLYNLATR